MRYDIVIIGAGPAGSTLARLLNSKYKVLVVDKRDFKGNEYISKSKCCGGLLAPDAQKALAQFGLALPKQVIVDPQMFSVECLDLDNKLLKYYQRHYINVNRELFDRWLLSLVPDNVDKMTNTLFKGYDEKEDYIEVKLLTKDGAKIVNTKLLIGADGATSKIRRSISSNEPELYVSIQKWYKSKQNLPHYVSVFDKDITDYYSWVIQKKGYTIVGSALKQASNCQERFNTLVNKLNLNGFRLGQCIKTEGTWIIRPRSLKSLKLFNRNIALVGEAAGFISPSSAEGISYALKSASALAKAINKSIFNYSYHYNKNTLKLKLNILIKNQKLRLMYNKYTRFLIMKTGVLSMNIEDNNYYQPIEKLV